MGDHPRYIPEGSLVEVTTRTIHGRFLLRPSRDLNEIVGGILARAARLHGVGIVHFTVLANHYHLLLRPGDARRLAGFMCYLNGNLAREAGRLHGWRERLWSRRYRAVVVSDEPAAQVARLRYLLANGCKEGLVASPTQWPGASGIWALLTGEPVRGWWFDRTAEYEARRRGEPVRKYSHGEETSLTLVPLPCWEELSAEAYRQQVAGLVRTIEAETRTRLRTEGGAPVGPKRILALHPHDAPDHPRRSPAPRFHAATTAARRRLEHAFHDFRGRYRRAAAALRTGAPADFPPGCFLPRPPYHPRGDPSQAAAVALG